MSITDLFLAPVSSPSSPIAIFQENRISDPATFFLEHCLVIVIMNQASIKHQERFTLDEHLVSKCRRAQNEFYV